MAQKAMTDIKFLDKLKKYEKDNIPQPILDAVNKLGVNNPEVFNTARIAASDRAAGGLAKWCQALYRYAEALKVVKPKRAKVAKMTEQYEVSMAAVVVPAFRPGLPCECINDISAAQTRCAVERRTTSRLSTKHTSH